MSMRLSLAVLAAILAVSLHGCGSGESTPACEEKNCPSGFTSGEQLVQECQAAASAEQNAICDPSGAAMTAAAPEVFNASITTSVGTFVLQVNRSWAPKSADRFYHLMRLGYYDDSAFYRAVQGFVVQWGPSGNPAFAKVYANNNCVDAAVPPCWVSGACFYVDDVRASNKRGFVAMSTDVRSSTCSCNCSLAAGDICAETESDEALVAGSELYVNLVDNSEKLDPLGFAPFAEVVQGMDIVDSIYEGYGEMACSGICGRHDASVPCEGPDFRRIYTEGATYLSESFPQMTTILNTSVQAQAQLIVLEV